jgi:hypothetical protein
MKVKVVKKLETTRSKVSKEWSRYRKEKKHILGLKRLPSDLKRQRIESILDETRSKIHVTWTGYREQKYAITHQSPYKDFSFVKTLTGLHKETDEGKKFLRFHETTQKIFKANRGFNVDRLDEVVPQILDEPRVRGVLVVFEVTSQETGQRQHVSNYITSDLMDIINERGETVYEYVVKRFQAGTTKDYNLKFIYLRVIYEKS